MEEMGGVEKGEERGINDKHNNKSKQVQILYSLLLLHLRLQPVYNTKENILLEQEEWKVKSNGKASTRKLVINFESRGECNGPFFFFLLVIFMSSTFFVCSPAWLRMKRMPRMK